jgi:hypothetical protein
MKGIEEIPPRMPLTLEPPNPKEKGLEITLRKSPRKGSENHKKGQMGKTHPSLEEPRRVIYTL